MNPKYFLSPGTFICPTDLHWIVADISRDKYFTIPKRHFDLFGPCLDGWPSIRSVGAPPIDELSPKALELAHQLLDRKLITADARYGKSVGPPNSARPIRAINPTRLCRSKMVASLYTPHFISASARADYLLRHWELAEIITLVRSRKTSRTARRRGFDFEKAERLALVFNMLRPIYPRDYLCMFDSLALIQFFAYFGVYPGWVFGVTADPFLAHCWVQEETTLLNDTLERVLAYNPIMDV